MEDVTRDDYTYHDGAEDSAGDGGGTHGRRSEEKLVSSFQISAKNERDGCGQPGNNQCLTLCVGVGLCVCVCGCVLGGGGGEGEGRSWMLVYRGVICSRMCHMYLDAG